MDSPSQIVLPDKGKDILENERESFGIITPWNAVVSDGEALVDPNAGVTEGGVGRVELALLFALATV